MQKIFNSSGPKKLAEIELVMKMSRANEEFSAQSLNLFAVGDEASMMAIAQMT